MKHLPKYGLLALALLCLCPAGLLAEDLPAYEVYMADRTDVFWYGVTGPGQSQSFYDEGWHILQENDFMAVNRFDNGWDSLANLTLRATDTDQFDPERFSVQKLDAQLRNDRVKLSAGDYYANFSQYTMNKGIKGGAAEVNFLGSDQNYVRLAYGSFDGQWAYLYRDREDEPMDRFGGGGRVQFAGEAFRVGLNIATVEDDADDANRTYETAYRQWVSALDWEYRFPVATFSGEHAYSDTDVTSLDQETDHIYGVANKLGLRAALGKLSARARWERVSPEFVSVAGGATPDRTRTYAKLDYKLSRKVRFFGVFDYVANNIENDRDVTTRLTTGEAGARLSRLFGRRSLNSTLALRRKWTDTTDDSRDQTSDRIKVSASDRFFRKVRVKGSFEAVLDDHKYDEKSPSDYFYSLSISSRHRLGEKWEISPSLEGGLTERENFTTGGDDTTKNFRARVETRYDDWFRAGLDIDRYMNDYDQQAAVDSIRDRQALFCEFRPDWLSGGRLLAEAANNDYVYDDSNLSYNEKLVKMSLSFDLEKKEGE